MKVRIPNWLLPILSLASVLLLIEGALALFNPHKIVTRQVINQYHPVLGWENRPEQEGKVYINRDVSFFRTHNNHGLRDLEDTDYDSDPEARHILLLGDSFFWGFGVDDEYVLSEVMEERVTGKVEFINGAVQGYGTDQQLIWLTDRGFRYHPETVVLGFFPTNDVDEIANSVMYGRPKPVFDLHGRELEVHNVPVPQSADTRRKGFEKPETAFGRLKQFLRYHTHMYPFVADRLNALPGVRPVLLELGLAKEYTGTVTGVPHLKLDPGQVQELSDALILEIRDACREQGARFLLVHIPRREHGPPGTEERVFGLPPKEWNDRVSAHLNALARREHLEFLDLLPVVRARAAKGEILYNQTAYDHHWSKRGHEVAAEAILAQLEKMNVLAPRESPSPSRGSAGGRRS